MVEDQIDEGFGFCIHNPSMNLLALIEKTKHKTQNKSLHVRMKSPRSCTRASELVTIDQRKVNYDRKLFHNLWTSSTNGVEHF